VIIEWKVIKLDAAAACLRSFGIILVNNQLDTLYSMYLFIYLTSLHVSSNPVLIIRRIELYQYIIWYISLFVGDCLVCWSLLTGIPGSHLHRVIHTR